MKNTSLFLGCKMNSIHSGWFLFIRAPSSADELQLDLFSAKNAVAGFFSCLLCHQGKSNGGFILIKVTTCRYHMLIFQSSTVSSENCNGGVVRYPIILTLLIELFITLQCIQCDRLLSLAATLSHCVELWKSFIILNATLLQ